MKKIHQALDRKVSEGLQSLIGTPLVTFFGAKDGGKKGIFKNLFIFYLREREKETSMGCLPYSSQPGIEPATWVSALIGNQTHDLLVHRTTLQPIEPHWPGQEFFFMTS